MNYSGNSSGKTDIVENKMMLYCSFSEMFGPQAVFLQTSQSHPSHAGTQQPEYLSRLTGTKAMCMFSNISQKLAKEKLGVCGVSECT
jgi:hypothetical protein